MNESYKEFLDRVHAEDVARERALHKPGHCDRCDDHRRSVVAEQKEG